MNITPIVFALVAVVLIVLSVFILRVGKEDPCVSIGLSFRAWCDNCQIRNWLSTNGLTESIKSCMQKVYNRTINTCISARSICKEVAGVG